MAKEPALSLPQAPRIGVGRDGALPLPWLADAVQRATALAGAHALLIHGPAGAGHLDLGLVLAQAALCEQTLAAGAALPATGCGCCASCHLVATRVHPDLLLVVPELLRVQLGWAEEDDSKPAKTDAKPSKDIKVEQIRQAIDWCRQTSGRGRGKVLLLHSADALNAVAANALLKTLEEPPGRLRLFLTSQDPERLLATVRSRCQRLPLHLPAPALAMAWLDEHGQTDAAPLLQAAGGSPLEALAWGQEGLNAALLAALPRQVAAGDPTLLAGRAVPRVVDLLLRLSHDAQVLAAGGEPRFFAAAHMPSGVDLAALLAWQDVLMRTARHDEHPWSAGLLIESLLSQAAACWTPNIAPKPWSLHSAR